MQGSLYEERFAKHEQKRLRSGFCERVIRREATETEGLVSCNSHM